jgi:predicted house-cleaning noncanonical NTP pyrophosphatase (MazG superfamily)
MKVDISFGDESKKIELYKKFGYAGMGLYYAIIQRLAKAEQPIKTDMLKSKLNFKKSQNECWLFMENVGLITTNSNGETFNDMLTALLSKIAIKRENNKRRVTQFRNKKKKEIPVVPVPVQASPAQTTTTQSRRTTREVEEPVRQLRESVKNLFLESYKEKSKSDYYWGAKDATALIGLIRKIDFKVKAKFPEATDRSPEIIKAFEFILKEIKNEWILDNFSIPMINTKFNDIYLQLKKKENGKQGNSKTGRKEREDSVSNLKQLSIAILESPPSPENGPTST